MEFECPLFSVMDQVVPYVESLSHNEPGLYFVETNQNMPMRRNGWYPHIMISYCLEQKLIQQSVSSVGFPNHLKLSA